MRLLKCPKCKKKVSFWWDHYYYGGWSLCYTDGEGTALRKPS